MLRFEEIRPKTLRTPAAKYYCCKEEVYLLYTRHQALPKKVLAVYRIISSQFGAKFMAKKCQVSENYVKKMDGLAQKEGG